MTDKHPPPFTGAIPATGIVNYNGIAFPPAKSSSMSMTPIYTSSGRMVKYIRYVLTIECILASDALSIYDPDHSDTTTTDVYLSLVRQRLLEPHGNLEFLWQGLGRDMMIVPASPDNINTPTPEPPPEHKAASISWEFVYGPKPTMLSWEPIGDSKACVVKWECTFHLAPCDKSISGSDSQRPNEFIMEFEYSTSWDIGRNGLTTRTITGHYEIASAPQRSLAGGPQISARVADQLRNFILGMFPQWSLRDFHRESNFFESEDKRTMEFNLVDTQIDSPNPYFPGLVSMDVDISAQNQFGMVFSIWSVTVSGNLEVAPGYSKRQAFEAFKYVLHEKNLLTFIQGGEKQLAIDIINFPKTVTDEVAAGPVKRVLLLMGMEIRDSVFSRKMSFSFTFWLRQRVHDLIFSQQGLKFFSPLGGLTWDQWQASMINVQSPRGVAGLATNRKQDPLVNICTPEPIVPENPNQIVSPSEQNPPPKKTYKDSPYVGASQQFYWEELHNTAIHRHISEAADPSEFQGTTQQYRDSNVDTGVILSPSANSPSSPAGSPKGLPDIIQRRGGTSYLFHTEYQFARVGAPPVIPVLKRIGGQTPTLIDRKFVTKEGMRTADGQPVWLAAARLTYIVPNAPAGDLSATNNRELVPEPFYMT